MKRRPVRPPMIATRLSRASQLVFQHPCPIAIAHSSSAIAIVVWDPVFNPICSTIGRISPDHRSPILNLEPLLEPLVVTINRRLPRAVAGIVRQIPDGHILDTKAPAR